MSIRLDSTVQERNRGHAGMPIKFESAAIFSNQLASYGEEREIKESKLLADCLLLLTRNKKSKLKQKLKTLTYAEKQGLYTDALFTVDERRLRLAAAIEEFAQKEADKKFIQYVNRGKEALDFSRTVCGWFGLKAEFEDASQTGIVKQIQEIQIMLGSYKIFKNRQSHKQFETYDEFVSFNSPIKVNALLNHELDMIAFILISEQIESLKLKLRSEPLDEAQFHIVSFTHFLVHKLQLPYRNETKVPDIFDSLNRTAVNAFFVYRRKLSLLQHLDVLARKLTDILNELTAENMPLKSEQLKTDGTNDYKESYEDYWMIRDIDSLERIMDVLELVGSVDLSEGKAYGKLIIERALQVVGEFLSSNHDSPYLSDETRKCLKGNGVPIEALIELKDYISLSLTLCEKIKMEKHEDDVFIKIQIELGFLETPVFEALNIVKAKLTKWQLGKVIEFVAYDTQYNRETINAVNELESFIQKRRISPTAKSWSDRFEDVIDDFISGLNAGRSRNHKISDGFSERLTALENVKDACLNKHGNSKLHSCQKGALIYCFTNDRRFQAIVELLLLDLMKVLVDCSIRSEGLVEGDLPLGIETWSNAPLRNYQGHGSTVIRAAFESKKSEIIISCVLKFIGDKQELAALVKLLEDDEVRTILSDAIKNSGDDEDLDENLLKKTHHIRMQKMLTDHQHSLATVLKSPYKRSLLNRLYADTLKEETDVLPQPGYSGRL